MRHYLTRVHLWASTATLALLSPGAAHAQHTPIFPVPVNQTGENPTSIITIDLDNNGVPDAIVANSGESSVSVFLSNDDGSIRTRQDYETSEFPVFVAAHDLNGDGAIDIVTPTFSSNGLSILLGNGDGTFAPKTDVIVFGHPDSVAIADFNNDNIPDFAVSTRDGTIELFINATAPGDQVSHLNKLDSIQTNLPTLTKLTAADLDNNGLKDLITITSSTNIAIFLQTTPGTFAKPIFHATAIPIT
ncbi:MAG: hypothetical protein COC23_01225, partial [Hyphomicrobiales bacterium]